MRHGGQTTAVQHCKLLQRMQQAGTGSQTPAAAHRHIKHSANCPSAAHDTQQCKRSSSTTRRDQWRRTGVGAQHVEAHDALRVSLVDHQLGVAAVLRARVHDGPLQRRVVGVVDLDVGGAEAGDGVLLRQAAAACSEASTRGESRVGESATMWAMEWSEQGATHACGVQSHGTHSTS